jgi:hypothetical protein
MAGENEFCLFGSMTITADDILRALGEHTLAKKFSPGNIESWGDAAIRKKHSRILMGSGLI